VIALAKDTPAITAALQAVRVFAQLTESQAALLAATGVRRKVLAGEVVFQESQSSDGLHVVLEGRLRI
jgi:CRP-like cAMP-binding protein